MLLKPKSKLSFKNKWVHSLKFREHTDYDLAGNVSAISIKSESGSVFDFYRSNPLENPEDFSYTALYEKVEEVKNIVDYFDFIQTSRVRIHKQDPGQKIDFHTDGNNVNAQKPEDYNLRMVTALTESEHFIYRFKFNGEIQEMSLEVGESVIFDPDLVEHSMENTSEDKTRYALVQVFKAYPVTNGLLEFIKADDIILI